ncbi:methyltransferase [bacterium]|nr:methyltransferase [bacterium]
MPASPREIVKACLEFNHPERLPRDLWLLPWAQLHYPAEVARLQEQYPNDIVDAPKVYPPSSRIQGDEYRQGSYTDEWGCVFTNIQDGLIGEVRTPLLADIADWRSIQPPYELLPVGQAAARAVQTVDRFCEQTDRFVLAAMCPRPWERYQFIRGSENTYLDIMTPERGCLDLLRRIHEFYLREIEFWMQTQVDGIRFMDDWGSQNQLLIPPRLWRELFQPLYQDYCDLAKAHGKKILMHSDGHIQEIYPDLIRTGVDAINSQLFCMDLDYLQRTAVGRITFWGEIDRQHVLPSADPEEGRKAVRRVASHLYDPSGGLIVQFELGAGANPAVAQAIFEEWEKIQNER